jgi:hypothetical protein
MDLKQFIKHSLTGNTEFLKWTLSDFTDADMYVRPCNGANHATWQLGHLCSAEVNLTSACGAKAFALPAGFGDMFNKKTAEFNDASKFGDFATKEALLNLFGKIRAGTIAWVDGLSQADLDKPAPEKFQKMWPTIGALAEGMAGHVQMHTGQFQVIRRKLGKPVLF